jgi:hypothetical protein
MPFIRLQSSCRSFHAAGTLLPDVKTPIDWFLSSRAEICVTPVSHVDTLPFSISHGKALGARRVYVCMLVYVCPNGVNSTWICCFRGIV